MTLGGARKTRRRVRPRQGNLVWLSITFALGEWKSGDHCSLLHIQELKACSLLNRFFFESWATFSEFFEPIGDKNFGIWSESTKSPTMINHVLPTEMMWIMKVFLGINHWGIACFNYGSGHFLWSFLVSICVNLRNISISKKMGWGDYWGFRKNRIWIDTGARYCK